MVVIAVLKEIKNNENRVGLTPEGAKKLVAAGHKVIVQKNAGLGAGFINKEYEVNGAAILDDSEEIVTKADIIVKIKEPLPDEYHLLDLFKNKILFTYLHLAGVDRNLTEKLLENNITAIAYETIEDEHGLLPLLAPMSEIAGILAVQYGSQYLQLKYGGKGITLGRLHHVLSANVVVVGAGIAGQKTAIVAAGMGSNVSLLEIDDRKIEQLKISFRDYLGEKIYSNVQILKSTKENLDREVKKADLLVGAVLVHGAKAPKVVTEEMVRSMKNGSVIVDIAIDQGGCIWGSNTTSHSDPTYRLDGKIYCCIPNMPGQVALQSTLALTQATFPFLLKMANQGIVNSIKSDKGFAKGINTYKGMITNKAVADSLIMKDSFVELAQAIEIK